MPHLDKWLLSNYAPPIQKCPTSPCLSLSLAYLSLTPSLLLFHPLSFSLYPLPLSHSLSLSVSFYPISLSSSLFLSLIFTPSLSIFFFCPFFSHTLTLSHSHSLTLLHSLSHSLTLSLSHFLTFLLSTSLTLTHSLLHFLYL